jgi:predicted DNA-binding transcriptional regulator AlpA
MVAAPTTLIKSATLRARLGGISEMTLWRRMRDPVNPLPQPIRINGGSVRFWRVSDVEAWLARVDHAQPEGEVKS